MNITIKMTSNRIYSTCFPEPGTPYKKYTFLYGIPNDKYSLLSSSLKNSAIEFTKLFNSPCFKYNVSILRFGVFENKYQ